MIGGNIGTLLEGQSVGAVGGIEDAVDEHAVHIEIGLRLIVGDVEHLLLHLCRIVEAVVGLQLEVGTLGLSGKVLDGLRLSIGLRRILADKTLQEGIDVVGRLGHRLLQRIGSVVGIAHQLGLLGTQLGNLGDDGVGVVFPCAVGTMHGGLIHLLAKVAVVERHEERLLRGVHDHDGIGCLPAATLGVFLALGDVGIAQTSQLALVVDPHNGFVGGFGQYVAPLLLKLGQPQVDGLHALHLLVAEQCTLAHELLVCFLQQLLLLALKRVVLGVVDLTDALEEGFVEQDFVLEVGQHGLHLLLDVADLRRLVGIDKCEEHTRHLVEQSAALLVGQNGVLEGGRLLVLHNLPDVLASLPDGFLEGGQIVRILDLAEVGSVEGQLAVLQQRVLAF